jgi:hypothetical protein
VLAGAAGCGSGFIEGSGKPGSQTRRIGPVTEVIVKRLDVTLVQRDTPELLIEGDGKILRYVEAVEEGQTLTLRLREGRNYHYAIPLTLTLSLPRLKKLTLTEYAGTVRADGISGKKLELNADWGTIHLKGLNYEQVTANLKQFGKVKLSGTVDTFTFHSDFSGETIKAGDLQARVVEGEVTAGDVTVWATDELKVNTAGLVSVKYRGQPKNTGSTWGVEPLGK